MAALTHLEPDRDQLTRFIGALFRYADSETFVSLRGFDQVTRGGPARLIRPIQINGSLDPLIEGAMLAAGVCANATEAAVFAPPICTFGNAERARTVDLANGLVLSVELDDGDITTAWRRLEMLLGPATVVVQSGGESVDPWTSQAQPKLHIHWRLSEPTRAAEEHDALRHARDMACRLVGADPTGKPIVHPLRWPGSYNRKTDTPVMARIVACDSDAEIHLADVLDRLADAIDAAGLAEVTLPRSSDPETSSTLLRSALAVLADADDYKLWIDFGYALYRAAGDAAGFMLWDEWSRQSDKYNATQQHKTWQAIVQSVEGGKTTRTVGAGTIFFYATQVGWVRPEIDWADTDDGDDPAAFDPGPDVAGDAWGQAAARPRPSSDIDLSVLGMHRRQPPSFPLDVLGADFSTWVRNGAATAACPIDYVAAPLLATASALIGNARWAEAWNGWMEPPHLWIASVGDSGDGKSPGASVLFREVVPKLERAMVGDFPDRLAEWQAAAAVAEAREASFKDKIREAVKAGQTPPQRPDSFGLSTMKPERPRLKLNDVTVEKVALVLATAAPKGVLMHRAELAGFLLGMNQYNDAARPYWLECWDGDAQTVDRVKYSDPIQIAHNVVAWFGGIQPERLSEVMREKDDGLLARYIWCWPDPVAFARPQVTLNSGFAGTALERLRQLDLYRTTTPPMPIIVPLVNAAQPRMIAFGQDIQRRVQFTSGLLRSTMGKARGLALRLSLVLEFLWWAARDGYDASPSVISEAAFDAAARFVSDYAIPMAERVYTNAGLPPDQRNVVTLARWIVGTRPLEIHVRTMLRKSRLPGLVDAASVHRACQVLIDDGWLLPRASAPASRGRAREAYTINSRLWEALA